MTQWYETLFANFAQTYDKESFTQGTVGEVVYWWHAGGDWIPYGARLAEALLFDAAHYLRDAGNAAWAGRDASDGPVFAHVHWAAQCLENSGRTVPRFWESDTPTALEQLGASGIARSAVARDAILRHLDTRLKEKSDLDVMYRVLVLRTPINMIPWIDDLQHVIHDVQYYLGRKKHKAYYSRYSYAEKMEYLALIWGTIVMGLTGFMMWNPISTLRFLPGEAVPAAKAAHGGEAVLAVLAIIVWHFYHVHIKHFNKSMFTGKLSREEMEHEHPAELAMIESGKHLEPIPADVIKKRQRIYTRIAITILAVFSLGFYYFIGYETTAVVNPVLGETNDAFVRQTSTPTLTPTSTPTSTPTLPPKETPLPTATTVASVSEETTPTPEAEMVDAGLTWDGQIGALFGEKCTTCHGSMASGGLILSTYIDVSKGGVTGPIFTAGDAANSLIITKFGSGAHPYAELTSEELTLISEWINAGALEK